MLIKKIEFSGSLEYIEDIYDSNIDVFVTLDDDSQYNIKKISFLCHNIN
jgi:hypothetical protein